MQFDKDVQGKFSDLFFQLRKILLSFNGLGEVRNEKQTTYVDSSGKAVCMLRSDDKKLTLAFAQGVKLQKKYSFLQGNGKVVRHLYFGNSDEADENLIMDIIHEALVINIEIGEMKKLKSASRNPPS